MKAQYDCMEACPGIVYPSWSDIVGDGSSFTSTVSLAGTTASATGGVTKTTGLASTESVTVPTTSKSGTGLGTATSSASQPKKSSTGSRRLKLDFRKGLFSILGILLLNVLLIYL